ncbi:uncharacterized protein [Paramisgurnus dabryanus]|uniref:uncharacterized protein n=1 Tax=Paramisgurnus dabryanus TaxID=90735 RepID=UPI003CCF8433
MAAESYKKVFLETHNQYRRKHQAPDLKMSEALCKSAQQWADQMLSTKTLGHSETDNGENVYYAFSSIPKPQTGKEAVDSWYSEIKDYNFAKSGYQPKTGHFTQVVWKSTTEVGVGMATDGKTIFVVGQYSPAGNITNAGYYEKNVLPAGKEAADNGCSENKDDNFEKSAHQPKTVKSLVPMADESYKKVFLETHNQYRRKHQAPDLKMSEALCKSAQQWADHILSTKTLGHSDTDNGENVYYAFSSNPKPQTGKEAVDSWYSEIKDYNFGKSGHQPKTGHFTQVVWKSTTEVGVGMATDGKTIFVVGQYSPAGNITNAGYYEKNVLPAGKDALDNGCSKNKDDNFEKSAHQPKPGIEKDRLQ